MYFCESTSSAGVSPASFVIDRVVSSPERRHVPGVL